MLRQIDSKRIAEGVLDHQAVRRVRQGVICDHGELVVSRDEAVVLHVGIRPGLVDDHAGIVRIAHDLHVDVVVSGRHQGDHLVGLQVPVVHGIVPGSGEGAHVPLGKLAQRHRLKACRLTEALIGIIGAQRRPVMVGVEIKIFIVVRQEVVEGIDLPDILVLLGKHVAQGFPLVGGPQLCQSLRGEQHADAGRRRDVKETDAFRRQRVTRLIHQSGMVIGSGLVKAQTREHRTVDHNQVAVDGRFILALQAFPVLDHRILIDHRGLLHRRRFRCRSGSGRRFPFRGFPFRLLQQGVQIGVVVLAAVLAQDYLIPVQTVQGVHPVRDLQHSLPPREGVGEPQADPVKVFSAQQALHRKGRKFAEPSLLAHRSLRPQRQNK